MKKLDISEVKTFILFRGGKLLSDEYINGGIKIKISCGKGHSWFTRFYDVKNKNQWCPYCAKLAKPDIKELQMFAAFRNGRLLSTEYINSETKLEWVCEMNHFWSAKWDHIKNSNSWCPVCAKNNKPNITELQQHAMNKGGKLLSVKYETAIKGLIWECKDGHIWNATWNSIKHKNSWCPVCSGKTYKSELECRLILEKYFNKSFPNTRFYYNKQKFIELDCYNEELKIALEYNGIQHYKENKHFHQNSKTLENQQIRDKNKIKYCLDNNIKLIIVPYTEHSRLESFIKSKLSEHFANS